MADQLITATLFNNGQDYNTGDYIEPYFGIHAYSSIHTPLDKDDTVYLLVSTGNFTDPDASVSFEFDFDTHSSPFKNNGSNGKISGNGTVGQLMEVGSIRSIVNYSTFIYTITITYTAPNGSISTYLIDPKIKVNPGIGN